MTGTFICSEKSAETIYNGRMSYANMRPDRFYCRFAEGDTGSGQGPQQAEIHPMTQQEK